MRLSISLLVLIFTFLTNARSQNLLLNADFEKYSNCPDKQGQFEYCDNWYTPNISSPDYFGNCTMDFRPFSAPNNFAGHQVAYSGNAYAGLFLFEYNNYKEREYIEGELNSAFEKGHIYTISFYMSWGDFSLFPCDRIGFKFTTEKIKPKRGERINKPLKNSNGQVFLDQQLLKDKDNWHKVKFDYLAKGGEKFFTIGIFKNDLSKKEYRILRQTTSMHPLKVDQASYYYIDNVSIMPKSASKSNTLGREVEN